MSRAAKAAAGALLAVLLPALSAAQTSQPAVSTVDLRINPLLDMHHWVRSQLGSQTENPELRAALEAVAAFDQDLGGGLGWGLVEPHLARVKSAQAAADFFPKLPQEFRSRSGRSIPIRAGAVRMASAYVALEPYFLKEVWPKHREQLEATRARLNEQFIPKLAKCFPLTCHALGIRDPRMTIPAYLVAEAPFPAAFTYRSRSGGICVIGLNCISHCEQPQDSLLHEIIYHETLHVLDLNSPGEESVFAQLRTALQAEGLTQYLRDAPHTIMFIEAGERIRRNDSKSHRHYGEVCGYYAKVSTVAEIERPAWIMRLDGRVSLEDTVKRIVSELRERTPSTGQD